MKKRCCTLLVMGCLCQWANAQEQIAMHDTLNLHIVTDKRPDGLQNGYLRSVENLAIYESKKTELLLPNDATANLSTNNARQIFAKVPGLNIWESDNAGLQLGIGARGLSPNRTEHFNVRQNGYDISADALGYPEAYYTPPAEAIERIEVVRGAASLQTGTQFGGLLNFVMKKGHESKPMVANTRLSYGSFGFKNITQSIGGTIKNGKLNYYAFGQHKTGDGFRPNSNFTSNMAYLSAKYTPNSRFNLHIDYTTMAYKAKQAGGLSDAAFNKNHLQSFRARNWFSVNWNTLAIKTNYKINDHAQIETRTFGLAAQRNALGNLERINVIDFGGNRSLIAGQYLNVGNEVRLMHKYNLFKLPNVFLLGIRNYHGTSIAKQGEASNTDQPDFRLKNPNYPEVFSYTYHNTNHAFFAEHIFNITDKLSITPGFRYEYINTAATGFYRQRAFDMAGNLVGDQQINENQEKIRHFPLLGIGISYRTTIGHEFYGNLSQNYRAINYSDLRIANPNFVIDPNITDEKGFNADLGFRGIIKNFFHFDLGAFVMHYDNRIGVVNCNDIAPRYLDYRFRSNVAEARFLGLESMAEVSLFDLFKLPKTNFEKSLNLFGSLALIDARYNQNAEPSIRGKHVEMAPPVTFRMGLNGKYGNWTASMQYSYTAKHFTDATNAERVSNAVSGAIPSYAVADLGLSYRVGVLTFMGNVNNLFNAKYFTRRAEGYPGPGIIPASPRAYTLTIAIETDFNFRGKNNN